MKQLAISVKTEHVAEDPQATWDKMKELVGKALSLPNQKAKLNGNQESIDLGKRDRDKTKL